MALNPSTRYEGTANQAPEIAQAIAAGKFTVLKTDVFSFIALEQAHEQMNKMIKGDGGEVGLTENAAAFEIWMAAGRWSRVTAERLAWQRTLQHSRNG